MTAATSQLELSMSHTPSVEAAQRGFVSGGARWFLRGEGLAAFAGALVVYAHNGFSWPAFAILFLAPDLAMLGYLAGPRVGAAVYNIVHTYSLGLALAAAGFFGGVPFAAAAGIILIAHIGFDRALGYGLKYPTAFGDTHLGRTGRH